MILFDSAKQIRHLIETSLVLLGILIFALFIHGTSNQPLLLPGVI